MAPPLLFAFLEMGLIPYLGSGRTASSTNGNYSQNQKYLAGFEFPEHLTVTHEIEYALSHSLDILLVVPSYAFADTLKKIAPLLTPQHRIIWATKGLEPDTGRLLSDVATNIIGNAHVFGVLSGPTLCEGNGSWVANGDYTIV